MKSQFDAEVERILNKLEALDPKTEDYQSTVENLRVLCEARSKKPGRLIEMDTFLIVGGNILLGVMILGFERFNVITSKAFTLIRRV